jgi:hypothetical protein
MFSVRSLIGVFHSLTAKQFPCKARFDMHVISGNCGFLPTRGTVVVRIKDPETGTSIHEIGRERDLTRQPDGSMAISMSENEVTFPRPGDYQVEVNIDDDRLALRNLTLNRAQE